MSPLAPHSSQMFNHSTPNQRHSLLGPSNGAKFVYSLGDLYGMRHSQSRAPNLGNRGVLASISRQPPVVSNAAFPNLFNFNLMSSSLNQIHTDRRPQNQHRPSFRHQNHYNGGHMNNGERQRQPNQGKLHDLKLFAKLL